MRATSPASMPARSIGFAPTRAWWPGNSPIPARRRASVSVPRCSSPPRYWPSEHPATTMPVRKPVPSAGAFLGSSLASWGPYVLVGSPFDASGTGAVLAFDPETGAVVHTFTNPHPGRGDLFGAAVAGVGTNVLVGASLADGLDGAGTRVDDSGAAYLFDGTTAELLCEFRS